MTGDWVTGGLGDGVMGDVSLILSRVTFFVTCHSFSSRVTFFSHYLILFFKDFISEVNILIMLCSNFMVSSVLFIKPSLLEISI